MKALGATLVQMTAEETAELLANKETTPAPDDSDEPGMRNAARLKRSFFAVLRHAFGATPRKIGAEAVERMAPEALAAMVRGNLLNDAGRRALADMIEQRAGKMLSGENEGHLRAACEHMRTATDHVSGVLDRAAGNQADPDADPDQQTDGGTADEDDEDTRARRARGLQLWAETLN